MERLAELRVFVGPMFSGKTDQLIDSFLEAEGEGVESIAFKPAIDDRHPADVVRSHSGREIPAVAVSDVDELLRSEPTCVLIDEAQFFDVSLGAVVEQLRSRGCRVIVAGLDLDFARRPFEVTEALARAATSVKTLRSACQRCGLPAPFTQRLAAGKPVPLDADRFVVGDQECYEPRCARCWLEERADVLPA
jgi:thymidine kinase